MNFTSDRESRPYPVRSLREVSISTAMSELSINEVTSGITSRKGSEAASTPSQIPKLVQNMTLHVEPPSPSKSSKKTPKPLPLYLTRESNTQIAFDTDTRLEEVESMCSALKESFDGATSESDGLKDMITMYKARSMS